MIPTISCKEVEVGRDQISKIQPDLNQVTTALTPDIDFFSVDPLFCKVQQRCALLGLGDKSCRSRRGDIDQVHLGAKT